MRSFQLPSPCGVGTVLLFSIRMWQYDGVLPTREAHPSLSVQFILGLHRVGMVDCPCSWSQSPVPPEVYGYCAIQSPTLNYVTGLAGVANPHPKTVQCGQPVIIRLRGPSHLWPKAPGIQGHSYQAWYSKGLDVTSQQPMAKARPLFG